MAKPCHQLRAEEWRRIYNLLRRYTNRTAVRAREVNYCNTAYNRGIPLESLALLCAPNSLDD
jgi:hypothetical protein